MAEITLEQLTNGYLNAEGDWEGTGVFDKLISAVNKNIQSQSKKGRITGADYATVYVGSMQSVISQSIEFLLREKVVEEQIKSEQVNQLATKAKVEDELGQNIDLINLNLTPSTATDTKHHWAVENGEEANAKAKFDTVAAENNAKNIQFDATLKRAQLNMEYNLDLNGGEIDAIGTPFNVYKEVAPGVSQLTFNDVNDWKDNVIPRTLYELQLLKSRSESDVANNTTKGYIGDTYYKTYRSLQELMFALANSGIIDSSTDSVYTRIVDSMEKAMNKQAGVWGEDAYVDLDGQNGAES